MPLVGGANGQPSQVTVGPSDTLYFAEPSADAIGSVGVTSPKPVTVQNLPSGSSPDGITLGPDGNIWYTVPATNQIGFYKLTGTTPPTLTGLTSNSVPAGITSADNYLWFTQSISDQIGRLNPITGQITEFNAPAAMKNLDSKIVLGPDGNLWFTEFGAIAAFDPNNQNSGPNLDIKETIPLPGGTNEEPFGITAGPGDTIWYTAAVINSGRTGFVSYGVGVINTNTQTFTKEIPVVASSEPEGITAGPDGNIWFTVTGTGSTAGTIDAINPSTYALTKFAIPTNIVSIPDPIGIAAAPDGNLWFADSSGAIGVVADTQLVVTAQPPPDVSINSPFGLTVTDEYANGVVDTAFNGSVTIAVANNPSSGTLTGSPTLTVNAVKGVATFSGLRLNNAGSAYTLLAKSSVTASPTSVTSGAFNVVAGPATELVVTIEPPSSVTAGDPFGLTVTDEYVSGPVDTAFNGAVTVSLPPNQPGGSGAILGGTNPVTATNGVATFSGLTLNNAGNGYTLTVSGGGLSSTTTSEFNVSALLPPPAPTITGESAVFIQKTKKKGKKIVNVGKPVLAGYLITFSTAMNQGTLGNTGNYVMDTVVPVKKTKKKPATIRLTPVGFSVTSMTGNSVTLKPAGTPFAKKAGTITVNASSGVESAAGAFLAPPPVTLTIAKGGKSII